MGVLVHITLQIIFLAFSLYSLSVKERSEIIHTVAVLVTVYMFSNMITVASYRKPARRYQLASLEEGCFGCVPSVGHLHRRRLNFFTLSGSAFLMLMIIFRQHRVSAILFSTFVVISTFLAIQHTTHWVQKCVQCLLALPISILFVMECISNKDNVIASTLGVYINKIDMFAKQLS